MVCLAVVIPLAVLVVSNGLVAVESANTPCPDHYTLNTVENNGTCFRVFEDTPMTQREARDLCKTSVKDGDLLQVESIESNEMVAGSLTRGKRYWIGVTKDDTETSSSVVSYSDGNHVPFKAPWAWGEPNNHRNNELCVEMIANRRGAWNDKRCSKKRPFVCQTPAVQPKEMISVYDYASCDFENNTLCNYRGYLWEVATESHRHYGKGLPGEPPELILKRDINVMEVSCLSFSFQGDKVYAGYSSHEANPGKVTAYRHWNPGHWHFVKKEMPPGHGVSLHIWVGWTDASRREFRPLIDNIRFEPGACFRYY